MEWRKLRIRRKYELWNIVFDITQFDSLEILYSDLLGGLFAFHTNKQTTKHRQKQRKQWTHFKNVGLEIWVNYQQKRKLHTTTTKTVLNMKMAWAWEF